MFFYNLKNKNSDVVLAVCDDSIIDKNFEFKGQKIEIKGSFYGQKKANEKEILQKAKKSTIINAMGDNIVSLLVENDIVDEKNVLDVGVKHAQVIKI